MTEEEKTLQAAMHKGDIIVRDDREDHDDGLYKYPEE